MIIVSGLNPKTGAVRTLSFYPGKEGNARQFRARLRTQGYNTAFVNVVKDEYAMRDAFKKQDEEAPFASSDVTGYQLHSQGTGRGDMKNSHVTKVKANTLTGAIEEAEKLVGKWSDGHRGIVIYRAIKLVRKITQPMTEIVELP